MAWPSAARPSAGIGGAKGGEGTRCLEERGFAELLGAHRRHVRSASRSAQAEREERAGANGGVFVLVSNALDQRLVDGAISAAHEGEQVSGGRARADVAGAKPAHVHAGSGGDGLLAKAKRVVVRVGFLRRRFEGAPVRGLAAACRRLGVADGDVREHGKDAGRVGRSFAAVEERDEKGRGPSSRRLRSAPTTFATRAQSACSEPSRSMPSKVSMARPHLMRFLRGGFQNFLARCNRGI